jgi:hypothetical protein
MHQHDQQDGLPSLLFRVLQAGTSIKLEIYDISVFDGVVTPLLPVLPRRLESHMH